MTRKARVSLCMIVRDEAENLPRCLEAAAPYHDELCIVDTGSTDDTVAIAESYGARVKRIEWPDDFAVARNVSLEMATGDWILVLDADEVLRPDMTHELDAIVDDGRAIAAFLRFTNHGDDGKRVSCLILRLFRNDPSHRFEGAIHEQVVPSILRTADRTGQRIVDQALHIDHDGYRTSVNVARDKDARNRKHFEAALAKEPDNAYLWFKYGDFLRRFEDDEEQAVLDALGRACDLVTAAPDDVVREWTFCAEAFAQLALYRIRYGDIDAADALLAQGLDRCQPTATLWWCLGQLRLRQERWAEALEAFETCRSYDGRCVHIPAQPGITGGRSEFGIARALLGLGRKTEALERFFDGAERWPDCEDLVRSCARIEISRGNLTEAMQYCTNWLEREPEDGAFWGIGAEVLLELGMVDQADVWAARARENVKRLDRDAVVDVSAQCAAARGSFEEAFDTWNSAFHADQCKGGIALVLVLAGSEIPASIDPSVPEVRHAVQTLLRRLSRAPVATRIAEPLAAAARREDVPAPLRSLIDDFEPAARLV